MGDIKHNAIVVTGSRYAISQLEIVHGTALALFGSLVSPIIESRLNGFHSFFVAPDGSKEGWKESDDADKQRKKLETFIDSLAYSDGSNSIHYADVSYGVNITEGTPPSMIVKQDVFDGMINTAMALVRQIRDKEEITQEECDFANAFITYAKELSDVIDKMEQQKG
ncbi:hypothetical protein ACFVS2_21745 [Brevibacillus sp. NPDC058079]|uniref:hypothetical protein n=1 Tax=Brevibacillus sp. NPDC058079 TaxID=3346330 RepID=UPI0036E0D314